MGALRLAVALIVLSVVAPAGSSVPDEQALIQFNHHYSHFVREFFGCPAAATVPADCRPGDAQFDVQEWTRTREAAKRLFNLREN